jgi:hypothetical protein
MLLDANGMPIETSARRGTMIDAYQMPDGAIVDMARSMRLHQMIRDNKNGLRDKIAQADKEAAEMLARRGIGDGRVKESLHLAVLRHDKDKPDEKLIDTLQNNMAFGEKVQQKRISEENLQHTAKAVSG